MAKAAGGGFLGRSTKFTGLDVKRVYFVSSFRRGVCLATCLGVEADHAGQLAS